MQSLSVCLFITVISCLEYSIFVFLTSTLNIQAVLSVLFTLSCWICTHKAVRQMDYKEELESGMVKDGIS